MSNLYDVVKDVINCKTIDEANNRLFGVDGITINSQEYYQNIVSNFIKKKEYVIRKSGNNLVFDLKNYNDMWNIIFLGEYIKENDLLYKEYNMLLEEINKINYELLLIKDKHKSASSKDEHLRINEEYKEKELELKDKLSLKDNYKETIEVFYNIDWVKLENSNDEFEKQEAVKTLKQAINIVHKLRNNIQHGSSDLDGNIKIDNEQFNVSIPIDYIDGFNKGRIIANDEDKVIVEKTNTIASPLLESLGYDVKKVKSFFYNTSPVTLDILLEALNYDYDKLFKLSKNAFKFPIITKELLANYGIDDINKISYNMYDKFDQTRKLLEKYNIDEVSKFPDYAFEDADKTIKLIEKNGIDNINKIPYYMFLSKELLERIERYCSSARESDYVKYYGFVADSIIKEKRIMFTSASYYTRLLIAKYGISYEEAKELPDHVFNYAIDTMKLLENFSMNEICKLPPAMFRYYESLKYLIEKYGLEDVAKLPYLEGSYPYIGPRTCRKLIDGTIKFLRVADIKEISKLPNEAFINYNGTKLLLEKYSVDQLKDLPDNSFRHCYNTKRLLEKYGTEKVSKLSDIKFKNYKFTNSLIESTNIETVIELKDYIFEYNKCSRELLEKHSIEEISKLPYGFFVHYSFSKKLLEKYNIEEISKLPNYAFKYLQKIEELFNKYRIEDLALLPNEAFKNYKYLLELLDRYSIEEITKLPSYAFEKKEDTDLLLEKYNIGEICFLSPAAFKNPIFTNKIKDLSTLETINKLPDYIFRLNDRAYNLLNEYSLDTISKLSEDAIFYSEVTNKLLKKYTPEDINRIPFGFGMKADNCEYILKLIDNNFEELEQFPYEMLNCKMEILDDLFKLYNENVARSIFGLNNPKLIGTLVYCDSVFKKYQKEDFDYDLIDIDPIEIVKSGAVNTYKYRNNIAGMDDNLDSYKKQFIYHDNGDIRMVNGEFDLKANILDKLRNSTCHFRFKPVKDSEGNLVEDKIYLYDRDDNGIINFNMIIDIKDLVEIAREVELDLIRKNVGIDYNYVEENKYRSR